MCSLFEIGRRLLVLFRSGRFDADLDEETRLHRDLREEQLLSAGLPPAEAHNAATRRFGNSLRLREKSRDAWGWRWLDDAFKDLRYAARILATSPGFSALAVLSLALGMTAATTIFSVVNAVLIQPLPFSRPDRLVRLWQKDQSRGWNEAAVSAPDFQDLRNQQSTFEQLAALEYATFNLTGSAEPERLAAARITAGLVPTLGVQPFLGRAFLPEEEAPGNNRAVLLSFGLWQRRLGGNTSVLNSSVQLDGQSYTVVGVMPAGFDFPGTRDIWVPLSLDPGAQPWRADRANHNLSVFGRLKPGIPLPTAAADLNLVAERLERQHPDSNAGWRVTLRAFNDWLTPKETRRSLLLLFLAVGMLLLIACANVTNLLLARAAARRREIAIRSALGASRSRLRRQLLVESALLAFLGGAVGLAFTVWTSALIAANSSLKITALARTRVDLRVLGFSFALCLVTALIFGMAPAWLVSRINPIDSLKDSAHTLSAGPSQGLRGALVTAEVALTLVLLIGSGQMITGFIRSRSLPLGYRPEGVLTAQISLPASKYGDNRHRAAFYNQLLERLKTVPGVLNAAAAPLIPTSTGDWKSEIIAEGPESSGTARMSADANAVTPSYFATLGIPLLAGRDFTEQDGLDQPLSLIVSKTFAERFWHDQDPLGKRFRPGSNNPFGKVIGVVADVRTNALSEETRPAFYFPYNYLAMPAVFVVIATRPAGNANGALDGTSAAVRAKTSEIDSEQPVYNIRSMNEIISNSVSQPRFRTLLLSLFAAAALLLAFIGIYSVVAYLVAQRKAEVAVRMALGARRGAIWRMVVSQGMRRVVFGVGLGLPLSLALASTLKSFFFVAGQMSVSAFIAAPLLLAGVALIACYLPARRATDADPAISLRLQ